MTTFYRILDVHEKEHSVTVRYWSDKFSEFALRTNPEDKRDPPVRCRTDYHVNLWKTDMTPDEIHDALVNAAPTNWLDLLAVAADKPTTSIQSAKILAAAGKKEVVKPLFDGPIPR